MMKHNPYIFIKIGGPYLRSSFLRGDYQWFIDIAEDPQFAGIVASRVTDHLIAVGIEALHRSNLLDKSVWIFVEPRANMDVVELRRRYGQRLAFVGGLCNSLILPTGSDKEVRNHVEHVLSAADDGGLVIGSHSISNDVTQKRYELFMEILHQYGRPLPSWPN